jgi:hypothetical protein
MPTSSTKKSIRQASSVRHTRSIQYDHRLHPPGAPPSDEFTKRLTDLVYPAVLDTLGEFRMRGLRERILTLPVMVALVLAMVWRQLNGVAELTRLVQQELVFWVPPLKVSVQALEQRLRSLPAELFQKVLDQVLPRLHEAWPQRQRPLPAAIAWAQAHFSQVLVCDASTLDALMRKVGLLRGQEDHPLAGRITALLDLPSRLPWRIWFESNPNASEQRHWPKLVAAIPAGALLLFDLGYTNFSMFLQLSVAHVTWITRAKKNLAHTVKQVLTHSSGIRDSLVIIGEGEDRQTVRLIELFFRGTWYRYLTNELDPARLPADKAVSLYRQRWRIEDTFLIVKRLLGLAYFWGGSQNTVELQLWATWLLYAVLVDLTDRVAEALRQPFDAISMEMVFRSLYYVAEACHRDPNTKVITYLAAHAKLLGIVKRRQPNQSYPKGSIDNEDKTLTCY